MVDGEPPLPALPVPETFPFPYPQPYEIQLDLMRTVFRAIEERKIAIVSLWQRQQMWRSAIGCRLDPSLLAFRSVKSRPGLTHQECAGLWTRLERMIISENSTELMCFQVESPTGTGKSLTLLTSTLSWLAANRRRLDQAAEDSLRLRLTADDPDGMLLLPH